MVQSASSWVRRADPQRRANLSATRQPHDDTRSCAQLHQQSARAICTTILSRARTMIQSFRLALCFPTPRGQTRWLTSRRRHSTNDSAITAATSSIVDRHRSFAASSMASMTRALFSAGGRLEMEAPFEPNDHDAMDSRTWKRALTKDSSCDHVIHRIHCSPPRLAATACGISWRA